MLTPTTSSTAAIYARISTPIISGFSWCYASDSTGSTLAALWIGTTITAATTSSAAAAAAAR